MKTSNARRMGSAVFGLLLLSALSASATILTFESAPHTYLGKLYEAPLSTYGHRATANSRDLGFVPFTSANETAYYGQGNGWTPKIVVNFPQSGWGPEWYRDNFGGSASGVAYLYGPNGGLPQTQVVTLTPDIGFKVLVNSFDLKPYLNNWYDVTWSLHADNQSGPLLAGDSLTALASQTTSVTTGMDPYWGSVVLKIQITTGSIAQARLGFDNLNFDQVSTPEPGTGALLALAGLALANRRRRTHR